MNIYPAMDLRGGHCVRLFQGDFQRETIYSNEPMTVLNYFMSEGASWVHIVDLDGARDPKNAQVNLIADLLGNTSLLSQVGGGVRESSRVKHLLDAGCTRVMIGNMAVKEPEIVAQWLTHFGADKIVLTLDVQYVDGEPYVTTDAWQSVSQQSLMTLVRFYQEKGLKHLLCTDVSRDGTLQGSHHALYQWLIEHFPALDIQASGGVNSLAELAVLKKMQLGGAVLGRSLYEKCFTLSEALKAVGTC
jgi:phosphoribosylformimino-5-aminoimidazole carboxamide ribotide isomerase